MPSNDQELLPQDITLYRAPGLHPAVTGDSCHAPCIVAELAVSCRKC